MTKKIVTTKYSKNIIITEMEKDNMRYFTATINGWNGFRFYSKDNDFPQNLLNKTLIKCKEISNELKVNEKIIQTLDTDFYL